MERTKVYFGYIENDGLVFVTAQDADEITRLEYARLNASTWSGFAAALREQGLPEEASEIEGELARGDVDDDDFEAYSEAVYGDGDWGGLWLPAHHANWILRTSSTTACTAPRGYRGRGCSSSPPMAVALAAAV